MRTKNQDEDARMDSQCDPTDSRTASADVPASHTPGPWRAGFPPDEDRRRDESRAFICRESGDFYAIDIYAPRAAETLREHYANARLIAAAPDMLAALKALHAEFEHLVLERIIEAPELSLLSEARAAIAKATEAK